MVSNQINTKWVSILTIFLDPQSNDDFETLIDVLAFRDLELGHTCITVEDSHSSLKPGENATLQIKYISDFDTPRNQTFYACADIYYVEHLPYDMDARCFNATMPDNSDDSDSSHGPEKSGSSDKDGSNEDDDDKNSDSGSDSGSGGGGGLSGGAIAGIVIGVVAGLGAVAAGALLFYRKRQQRLRAERQRESARNVKIGREDDIGKNSASSLRMQNLP